VQRAAASLRAAAVGERHARDSGPPRRSVVWAAGSAAAWAVEGWAAAVEEAAVVLAISTSVGLLRNVCLSVVEIDAAAFFLRAWRG
jgi:hypothetical protein